MSLNSVFKPSMGGGRGLRLRKQLKRFFFLSLFARCSGEKWRRLRDVRGIKVWSHLIRGVWPAYSPDPPVLIYYHSNANISFLTASRRPCHPWWRESAAWTEPNLLFPCQLSALPHHSPLHTPIRTPLIFFPLPPSLSPFLSSFFSLLSLAQILPWQL